MSAPDWPPSPWGTDANDRVERSHYPDGTLKSEIHYRNTLEHGWWREFNPNGTLAAEYLFQLGVYDTVVPIRIWYPDGRLRHEWYPNGGGRDLEYTESGTVVCRYRLFNHPVSARKYAKGCARHPEVQRFPELEKLIAEEVELFREHLANLPPAPVPAEQQEPNAADDGLVKGLLSTYCEEAFAWLLGGQEGFSRNLGDMDWHESIDFVRKLYDKGATRVIAAEIEQMPGTTEQTTNLLLVQLPSLPKDRKKLFAIGKRHAESQGFEAERDRGQRFLFFKLC